MRISDWSSDVCSSDLPDRLRRLLRRSGNKGRRPIRICLLNSAEPIQGRRLAIRKASGGKSPCNRVCPLPRARSTSRCSIAPSTTRSRYPADISIRSEEHTSELQSLMRISYAVLCLKKKKQICNRFYSLHIERTSPMHAKNHI